MTNLSSRVTKLEEAAGDRGRYPVEIVRDESGRMINMYLRGFERLPSESANDFLNRMMNAMPRWAIREFMDEIARRGPAIKVRQQLSTSSESSRR